MRREYGEEGEETRREAQNREGFVAAELHRHVTVKTKLGSADHHRERERSTGKCDTQSPDVLNDES